jgi:hypothetical protein
MTVAHAIEPNFDVADQKGGSVAVVAGGFPIREVYWLRGQKTEKELSRRGFHEAPFAAARWATKANDPYGRGPAMKALGDAKQLQRETIRKEEFLEKGVRPPMVGGVAMKNEPASIQPGHVTYAITADGREGFKPAFEVNAQWMAPITEDVKDIRARIDRSMYVDVFMAISRMEGVQPRNELELTKRDLERLQQIGPFIEIFETEVADPLIQRALRIMERRGLLRPKPPSLRNVPLKISYHSMLKQAQVAAETASMERTFQVAGNLSAAAKAAGRPDPIDNLNLDRSLRIYGDKTSFPADCWFTEGEVAQQRAARTQAMQQRQAMQATLPAVTAAKTLSETQVGGGQSALGAILGTQGGGG